VAIVGGVIYFPPKLFLLANKMTAAGKNITAQGQVALQTKESLGE
jgi:hypothetical protein